MASTMLDYIEVPERILGRLGHRDPGTRTYRQVGPRVEFEGWFDAVCEACAPHGVVSPGAVGMYTSVSRAGVHKRIKEGRLTAFLFHVVRGEQPSRPDEAAAGGGRPYTYIPVQECRGWAELLKARARGERVAQAGPKTAARAVQADDSWRVW